MPVKYTFIIFLFSFFSSSFAATPLQVSANGRFLEHADNSSPFFWLGDTAWHLIELNPTEVDKYLAHRASQGFNLIQGPTIIRTKPFGGFNNIHDSLLANYKGEVAFSKLNPLTLNEKYLQHIDYIVDKANANGLYVALASIWGSTFDKVFDVDNSNEAYEIARQLGDRYKNKSNVIWIVSGEYQKIAWETKARDRTSPSRGELNLLQRFAEGLEFGHGGKNLMTIHPDGRRSSYEHFGNAAWLDFNMIQTFDLDNRNATIVEDIWNSRPVKPVINAEPGYENRNKGSTGDPMSAFKVRYEAYLSVFQGAFGHTYGQWDIWQAKDSAGNFIDQAGQKNWWDDLNAQGADDMRHLRALIESRPFVSRIPAQTMFVGATGNYKNLAKQRATSDINRSYSFVYFPQASTPITINLTQLSGTAISAWWFNPRDGLVYDNSGTLLKHAQPFNTYNINSTPRVSFDPPGSTTDEDWVLVLDVSSKNYTAPGQSSPM